MNPELRRYLWLELGVHRRIAAPAALFLVFALFAVGEGPEWASKLYTPASVIAFVALYLWGARQVAGAVAEEVRDGTWDAQRLSALSPWDMAWGKLLGAPVFAWYVGTMAVAVMAFALAASVPGAPVGWEVLLVAAGALAIHGAALATGAQAVRRSRREASRVGSLFLLLPVAILLWLLPLLETGQFTRTTHWFGLEGRRIVVAALSAVAFAGWGVLAAYRSVARELQVRQLPWAWPAFTLWIALWAAGFVADGFGTARSIVLAGVIASVAATYFALFTDPTTGLGIRRVVLAAKRGDLRRALEELPLWPVSLALGLLFALAAPAVLVAQDDLLDITQWKALGDYAARAPMAVVLAALRDGAILAFFAFGAKPRRVEAVTILYLALLWWIVPGLLAATGLAALAKVVNPFFTMEGPGTAVVMGAQAAIALFLAAHRWRANYAAPKPA